MSKAAGSDLLPAHFISPKCYCMRKLIFLYFLIVITSCKKETVLQQTNIPTTILEKIEALGYNAADVQRFQGDYLVEGDIRLSEEDLNTPANGPYLRIAGTEQYRTLNLIAGTPRTITIKVSGLGTAFVVATDTAISRFNHLGISLTFVRITTGTADITISGFNQAPSGGSVVYATSGFPSSSGNPYPSILVNTNTAAFGSNPNVLFAASVIQHEIGHCIGFRHSDCLDRSFSCGGTAINEGAAGVGAILIPGTPSAPDANSWMLACNNGGNRTFNANDIIALNYLY